MITPNVVLSPEDMQDNLETLIDKTSANFVLNCIVQIAHGKAVRLHDELEERPRNNGKNWQANLKHWQTSQNLKPSKTRINNENTKNV